MRTATKRFWACVQLLAAVLGGGATVHLTVQPAGKSAPPAYSLPACHAPR